MPAVTMPAHKKGDFLVDYEEKVFEDVKAKPGEKALVTFHTVAFEGSIGLVNILQALRLHRKGFKTTILLYGGRNAWRAARFPKIGRRAVSGAQNFGNQLTKFMSEGGDIYCCRFALQMLYGHGEPSLLPASSRSARLMCLILFCCTGATTLSCCIPGRSAARGTRQAEKTDMTQKTSVRVAAVQLSPDLKSADGTVSKVLAAIADASGKGAKLVVFPETFVPWYPYFSFVHPPVATGAEHIRLYDNAVVVPGPVTEAVAAMAKRHAIVVVLGVNERDHGTLYNAQLIFDADGRLILKRRKITPTFHERMIWGQGDGSGLKVVDTVVGRIGALALLGALQSARALRPHGAARRNSRRAVSRFDGGTDFAEQMEATIRHHALESGCFVVNATGWLTEEQIAKISPEEKFRKALRGGCMTAIVSPEGSHLVPPLTQGEGILIADLDMALIVKRKRMMDSVGHYARPELLHLVLDDRAAQAMEIVPHPESIRPRTSEWEHVR